jgi:hypothetical protein
VGASVGLDVFGGKGVTFFCYDSNPVASGAVFVHCKLPTSEANTFANGSLLFWVSGRKEGGGLLRIVSSGEVWYSCVETWFLLPG